jgi:hypothetical protein
MQRLPGIMLGQPPAKLQAHSDIALRGRSIIFKEMDIDHGALLR